MYHTVTVLSTGDLVTLCLGLPYGSVYFNPTYLSVTHPVPAIPLLSVPGLTTISICVLDGPRCQEVLEICPGGKARTLLHDG
jgi:hypothetical protein